jgi:hypothetical protein
MDEDKLNELRAQFDLQRERLKRLRDLVWIRTLGTSVVENGFKLRGRWLQSEDSPSEFPDLPSWIDHAAGVNGGGAAISKMLRPDEVLGLGDRFGEHLVRELKQFAPLLDAIYSDTISDTAEARTEH